MEPRTYRAKSIQAAISMIKEEIGKDAVILSTKRIPKSVRNPYGSDMFEVTAADQKILDTKQPAAVKKQWERRHTPLPGLAEDQDPSTWQTVQDELAVIKDMLFVFGREDRVSGMIQQHPESLKLYTRLIRFGFSERRARWLVDNCVAEDGARGVDGAASLSRSVLARIQQSVKVTDPFSPDHQRSIAAFIGPTGVGKTTTIAKVAADLSLKKKRKVGIISIDNYRIGALEQIKSYASIMGISCLPAFTPEDFQVALKKMQHHEIILIDTAGHSHFDETGMAELKSFFEKDSGMSSHLVMSANMDRFDMADAVACFGMFQPESFIFTKLDETRRRCMIIEQSLDKDLPISFITNGQNVPDDIVVATPGKIVKLIFAADQSINRTGQDARHFV